MLFDPGEVFEVVQLLAVVVAELAHVVGGDAFDVAAVVAGGVQLVVWRRGLRAALRRGSRTVSSESVSGANRTSCSFISIELGGFDGGDDVADAGDAQQAELVDEGFGDALFFEEGAAGFFVEQAQELQALFVVDGDDHVGVADVVDPGDVLVADAFDAVLAEAAGQERGALQGFGGDDADVGVLGAQEIAGGDGAGAAGGGDVAGEAVAGLFDAVEDFVDDAAGDVVVPDGVAELFELVEDDAILRFFLISQHLS